jgi:hypothetical protein
MSMLLQTAALQCTKALGICDDVRVNSEVSFESSVIFKGVGGRWWA